jgi:chemotaxis family two-component system response regulator Rcp1
MDKPVGILLVEDNPADVVLLKEGLAVTGWSCRVHVAVDGEEALRFLGIPASPAKGARPDLILLDYNIPRKNGLEVMSEIRADLPSSTIPVIVLSGAREESRLTAELGLKAGHYMVKPNTFREYVDMVRTIETIYRATGMDPSRI